MIRTQRQQSKKRRVYVKKDEFRSFFIRSYRLTSPIRSFWREFMFILVWVVGWFFFTWALADLLDPVVWKFSIGIFLLGVGGYKFIWALMSNGLYTLMQGDSSEDDTSA